MIGYLKGIVSHLFPEHCFIDIGGVGYRVFIPQSTRDNLKQNIEVSLYTYLNVREDALILYGFFTPEEYDLFLHLISVTGIGPKAALNVLSTMNPSDFYLCISQKRTDVLTKVPGVGKKTAERIILELKDKIKITSDEDFIDDSIISNRLSAQSDTPDNFKDALAALTTLGYNQYEVTKVLRKIKDKDQNKDYSTEDLIKFSLQILSSK